MTSGQSRTGAALHFNSLLPRLNVPVGPLPLMVIANLIIASPKSRNVLARKAAKLNAGRIPTELSNSVEVFRSYLHGLNSIDGLFGVYHPHGYMMEFDAGLLFDSEEIGRRIAQLVHEHFYSSMEFSFEIDPSFQSRGPQQAEGEAVAVNTTDVLLDETSF
jgi:hypothetical protein